MEISCSSRLQVHCSATLMMSSRSLSRYWRSKEIKIIMLGRAVSVFGRSATRVRTSNLMLRDAENAAGENMPFQTKNKTRLLFTMATYLGTAFAIPFIAVRFQMYKKSSV